MFYKYNTGVYCKGLALDMYLEGLSPVIVLGSISWVATEHKIWSFGAKGHSSFRSCIVYFIGCIFYVYIYIVLDGIITKFQCFMFLMRIDISRVPLCVITIISSLRLHVGLVITYNWGNYRKINKLIFFLKSVSYIKIGN